MIRETDQQILLLPAQPMSAVMDSQTSSDLSSDLSSVGSLSPPPVDYPSPVSSQEYDTALSSTQPAFTKHGLEDDDLPPPAKKRKITEIKPRTTEHLNLQSPPDELATDQKSQLDLLLKILRNKRKIVVIAGAGISVSAGIPDFRSSTGLFSTLRSDHKLKASGKHLFDASVYQTDSSTSSFHDMVRSLSKLVSDARPTAFHQMLATLANEGRLMRLYTQNVDGIDTSLPPLVTSIPLSMKGPWPRTIQLHGGLGKMVCSKCNHLSDFEAALFQGPLPPPCTACMETDKVRTDHAGKRSHGIGRLRPRIVLYNEHNPDEEAIGTVVSADLRTRPDALIVVGTSMKIPGVKRIVREMCGVIRGRKNGLTVWINHEPPPVGKEFEDCWDLVVKGSCDEVAARADMRRWDDDGMDYKPCTELEVEHAKQRDGEVNVVIQSTKTQNEHDILTPTTKVKGETNVMTPFAKTKDEPSILTPAASPRPQLSQLSKIKLTLKPPKLTGPLDKKISGSSKITSKSSEPSHKPKSSSSRPPVKKLASSENSKIDAAFKVSKPIQPSKQKPKAKSASKASRASLSEDKLCIAMVPISSPPARNNGPLQFSHVIFPNLNKRRSEEIISPTGPLPSKMEHLLN